MSAGTDAQCATIQVVYYKGFRFLKRFVYEKRVLRAHEVHPDPCLLVSLSGEPAYSGPAGRDLPGHGT